MNRLYYVWTAGHSGATGEGPSGPLRHGPVLAASPNDARKQVKPTLTSWDGAIEYVTPDENYSPRCVTVW